ncbi:MAG: hypothetical protein AB1640_24790 [bacterium]
MKVCPECKAEYEDWAEECSDCLVRLMSESEYRERKKEEEEEERVRRDLSQADFVSVKIADNAFEADRIRGVLEEAGIPVLVRTFHDTAYDGLYVAQKGWAYLEVPRKEKERAQGIVQEFCRDFPGGLDEAVAGCPGCGRELGPDSKVCPHCRRPVEQGSPSEET